MAKYLITPTDSTKRPFSVEAASATVDEASGATLFKDANGDLVAKVYNASFRKVS